MRTEQIPQLAGRMKELAEYYGAREPTTGSMKVWIDALERVGLDDVLFVLTDWPKSRAKMPMASEVLTLVNERISDRLEEDAKRRRNEARSNADAVDTAARNSGSSEIAQRELRKIRAILATPKCHPMHWATKLRDQWASGGEMVHAQMQAVIDFARKHQFVDYFGAVCEDQGVPSGNVKITMTRDEWAGEYDFKLFPPGFEFLDPAARAKQVREAMTPARAA